MKTKTIVWSCSVIPITIILLLSLHLTVFANEEASLTDSIEIIPKSVEAGHEVIKETSFTLYQVAGASFADDALAYTMTEAFSGCQANLDDFQNENLAETLSAYAESEQIEGVTKSAESTGTIKYENLSPGLYLLVQEERVSDDYSVSPFLASVPMPDGDTGDWIHHVVATPKAEKKSIPEKPDPTPEKKPPKEPDPPPKKQSPEAPAPKPATQPTPSPVQPDPPFGKLKQTGQLNWPIPVLGGLGIVLSALGWRQLKSQKVSGDEADASKEEDEQ